VIVHFPASVVVKATQEKEIPLMLLETNVRVGAVVGAEGIATVRVDEYEL
jgi:hypothetical protein